MFSGNILQRIPYFSRKEHDNDCSAEDLQLRLGDNYLSIADNKLAYSKSTFVFSCFC